MLQIRNDRLTPEAIGDVVLTTISQARQALEGGALLTLDGARARLRILPFAD